MRPALSKHWHRQTASRHTRSPKVRRSTLSDRVHRPRMLRLASALSEAVHCPEGPPSEMPVPGQLGCQCLNLPLLACARSESQCRLAEVALTVPGPFNTRRAPPPGPAGLRLGPRRRAQRSRGHAWPAQPQRGPSASSAGGPQLEGR